MFITNFSIVTLQSLTVLTFQQMRWTYFNNGILKLTLFVSVGVALITLYCYVSATSQIPLGSIASMMNIPSNWITKGSPKTSQPHSVDDPYTAINQDIRQSTQEDDHIQQQRSSFNYMTSKESENNALSLELHKDNDKLKISKKNNIEAKFHPYKVELMDDDGKDFSENLFTFSLEQIMHGVERIHQAAMAYEQKASQDPQHKRNYQNFTNHNAARGKTGTVYQQIIKPIHQSAPDTTINYGFVAQQRKKSPLSSLKHSTCDVQIDLTPCKCKRHLTSKLTSCPRHEQKQSEIAAMINETLGESTCNEWATMRGGNQSVSTYQNFVLGLKEYC